MLESHALIVRDTNPQESPVSDWVSGELVELCYSRLGIDDVRSCIARAQRRPTVESVQTLVVRTDFITHESQNALLKILEEPPESTRVVLVIPHDMSLLPTVLSRVQVIQTETVVDDSVFQLFLQMGYAERLSQIDQASKKKDTAWQRAMKQGLIAYIEATSPANEAHEYVARTLLTRGASNKMLLEQAALVLPVLK